MQVFKILSDKSKFEILKYIWNRRAYGGELEKEDNKIYYRADKKELGRILRYCEMIFQDKV